MRLFKFISFTLIMIFTLGCSTPNKLELKFVEDFGALEFSDADKYEAQISEILHSYYQDVAAENYQNLKQYYAWDVFNTDLKQNLTKNKKLEQLYLLQNVNAQQITDAATLVKKQLDLGGGFKNAKLYKAIKNIKLKQKDASGKEISYNQIFAIAEIEFNNGKTEHSIMLPMLVVDDKFLFKVKHVSSITTPVIGVKQNIAQIKQLYNAALNEDLAAVKSSLYFGDEPPTDADIMEFMQSFKQYLQQENGGLKQVNYYNAILRQNPKKGDEPYLFAEYLLTHFFADGNKKPNHVQIHLNNDGSWIIAPHLVQFKLEFNFDFKNLQFKKHNLDTD